MSAIQIPAPLPKTGLGSRGGKWGGHTPGDTVDVTCPCGVAFKAVVRLTKSSSLYTTKWCNKCAARNNRESVARRKAAAESQGSVALPRLRPPSRWATSAVGSRVETTCHTCNLPFFSKVYAKAPWGTHGVESRCGKCKYVKRAPAERKVTKVIATTAKPAKESIGLFGTRAVRSTDITADGSYRDTSMVDGKRYVPRDSIVRQIADARKAIAAVLTTYDAIEAHMEKIHAAHTTASSRETELENRLRAIEGALATAFSGRASTLGGNPTYAEEGL